MNTAKIDLRSKPAIVTAGELFDMVSPTLLRVWMWVQYTPTAGIYVDAGKSAVKLLVDVIGDDATVAIYRNYPHNGFPRIFVGGPGPEEAPNGID